MTDAVRPGLVAGRGAGDVELTLPGLEIVGELGQGSQGTVYRARRDGCDFAVKVVPVRLIASDAAAALCRREAALLAWVNHPGVPTVYEVGELAGGLYMVMDLIDGRNLTRVAGEAPFSPAEVVEIGAQLSAALSAVHQVGLIHRDIKPSNVILQPGGRARLIDFGLAGRPVEVADGTQDDAATRAMVGTLAYAAPEQAGTLNRAVDARSDLYSLGVVLFECVTGRLPYLADDIGEMLRLHLTAPIPDPRALSPDVSDGLAAVLTKLLAKDPDDRYQSAAGLTADLGALAAEPAAVFPLDRYGRAGAERDPVPLVGRDAELASLVAAWADARQGHGGTALIEGGTGTGKTRLADELARQVLDDGKPVWSASCVPDSAPLSPLHDAVNSYLKTVAELPDAQRAGAHDLIRRAAGVAAPLVGRLSETLAEILGAAPPPDTGHEALVSAIAGFLADFAHAHGGAVLSFDDVQHLDEATRGVLRQLAFGLDETPLLILATVDSAAGEAAATGIGVAGRTVTLEALDPAAVADLVVALARGTTAGEVLVERLAARGAATPLEVREYVAAIVDAGLLVPRWGQWSVNLDGLAALALPADVVALVVRRLDRLDPQARSLLTTAAAIGPRFPADLLVAVSGLPAGTTAALLEDARAAGAVEARGDDFVFSHESLWTALLDGLAAAERRILHQRVADTLAGAPGDPLPSDPARLFLLAHQCLRGLPESNPDRAVAACVAAGRLALADSAPDAAIGLVEPAATLADRPGGATAVLTDIRELLGSAYQAAGRLSDALDAYTAALEATTDGLARARILALTVTAHSGRVEVEAERDAAFGGLSELGRPLPTNPLVLVLTSIGSFLAGLFVLVTRLGFGTARGERRVRCEIAIHLYESVTHVGQELGSPLLSLAAALRTMYPAARLGPSRQYVNALCVANTLVALIALPNYRGGFARARSMAAQLNDPGLVGHATMADMFTTLLVGRSDDIPNMLQLARTDRHLATIDYLVASYCSLFDALSKGHTQQARELYEAGQARLAAADITDSGYFLFGLFCDASSGRVADAEIGLRRVTQDPAFATGIMRVGVLTAGAHAATEQQDLGPAFDRYADAFADLGWKPKRLPAPLRLAYVAMAYGRIEQCLLAGADQRATALAAAAAAVGQLGEVTSIVALKAHHVVADAYLRHLAGDHDAALDALAGGDRDLREADAPWAEFEAARLRARALTALGRDAAAASQAGLAAELAETNGWPHRVASILREFPATAGGHRAGASQGLQISRQTHRGTIDQGAAQHNPYQQRLVALEQISRAASRVLDPTELTRIALDEAIRILGAERAYLFLTDIEAEDPDTASLLPYLGRDAAGTDIERLTGYGSTLVEGVRRDREPLVVTGTDEGAVLGSKSAVVYDLRSIMVVPMLLDGQLRGVIYLDSRIAKGIFTANDASILATITNYLASAVETARAAQLAVAVYTAEQRRDVAEMIRDTLAELTATLDPAEVLTRLADALRANLPGENARLVRREGDKLVLCDLADPGRSATLDPRAHADVLELMGSRRPVRSEPGVALPPTFTDPATNCALPAAGTWLAVPLRVREDPFGLVLLSAESPSSYGTAQIDLAEALAGQGAVAYDNARLFARVQQLASIDELTGLLNRRQLQLLARRELSVAHRRNAPLAAFMIDIDHFKRVNDEYGHHTGDQVIQNVASRLRAVARDTDIVGRYGGEEFVVILPDIGDDAGPAAERLLTAINAVPVDTGAGALPITISLGVAYLDPDHGDVESLLADADQALYAAKSAGRNRVAYHRGESRDAAQ